MSEREQLARLAWLEGATVRAYDSVEQRTTDEDLRQRLGGCRADHARHRTRAQRLLEQAGGEQGPSAEFVAFVEAELEAVERATDAGEAFDRLLLMERGNALFFADALASGLPDDARAVADEEREDEEDHSAVVATHAPHAPRDTWALQAAGVGGGVGVTANGGIVPGAVPSHLPQSPAEKQLEADIRGDQPPEAYLPKAGDTDA